MPPPLLFNLNTFYDPHSFNLIIFYDPHFNRKVLTHQCFKGVSGVVNPLYDFYDPLSMIFMTLFFQFKNFLMTPSDGKVLTHQYSQTRIKCSRPISSLRGLQGHKIFADAIIKILIPTKSIIDKNWYDQLFINKVVKIFTFQFNESVTKFYLVKVLSDFDEIFIGCGQVS